MATIDLGKIKLVWRGTYAGGTAYTVDDVVSHTDSGIVSSYICTTNSTGNAPSTGGSVHGSWAYLAKGASAYTSTLTTQGDILYRDGSGEARLGYGTAGQVLQTGGSGANPSWGTVSSDFVKIASTDITAVNSISFQDIFNNTTYNIYKIFISGVSPSTVQTQVRYKWLTSGSTEETSSTYYGLSNIVYRQESNNAGGDGAEKYNAHDYGTLTTWGGMSDNEDHTGSNMWDLTLFDPYRNHQNASRWGGNVNFQGSYSYEGGSNNYYQIMMNTTYVTRTTNTYSGIKFYLTSGNFRQSGTITIYGLKA